MKKKTKKVKQVFKLGTKTYDAGSLTTYGDNLVQDLQKVDSLIAQQQLALSVSNLAKGKLLEELEKESSKFTEIEDPDKFTDPVT